MPDGMYIKVNYTLGSKQGLLMIKLKKSKIVLDWYFKEHFTFPIRISCSLRVVGKLFFLICMQISNLWYKMKIHYYFHHLPNILSVFVNYDCLLKLNPILSNNIYYNNTFNLEVPTVFIFQQTPVSFIAQDRWTHRSKEEFSNPKALYSW